MKKTNATALDLIAEWGLIAASIAQQCKWRPQGQCLFTCKGLAVCNLDGLTLVDFQGRPMAPASSGTGFQPVDLMKGTARCWPFILV